MEQQRAWNDCLLCSFAVEDENKGGYEASYKRRTASPTNEAIKSARTSLAMKSAGPRNYSGTELDPAFDSDSDRDSISESEADEPDHIKDRSMTLAKHVASHLQMLMLLTLRFATLTNSTEDIDADEVNSNSVEIDEGDNATGSIPEKRSVSDLDIDMDKEELTDDTMSLEEDIRKDDPTIPDCDIQNTISTRDYYDNTAAEDDNFLQGVIGSGAYQSWRHTRERDASKGFDNNRGKPLDFGDPLPRTDTTFQQSDTTSSLAANASLPIVSTYEQGLLQKYNQVLVRQPSSKSAIRNLTGI